MKYYLNLDENNYILSIAEIGEGVEAELNLADYDLSGYRINAHKWDGETLVFDADRYAEIEAERKAQEETQTETTNTSVYDELAAAYREGVQEA